MLKWIAARIGEFRQSSLRDDLLGAFVSVFLAIPLAMGYGMFAFTALGDSYFAYGALAGLYAAITAGVVCVVLGDRTTDGLRTARNHDVFARRVAVPSGTFRRRSPARKCAPHWACLFLNYFSRRRVPGTVRLDSAWLTDPIYTPSCYGWPAKCSSGTPLSRAVGRCVWLRPQHPIQRGLWPSGGGESLSVWPWPLLRSS